ncbi:MAG: hypothetical protein V4617_07125 [Gemmatimonadota bacterium]
MTRTRLVAGLVLCAAITACDRKTPALPDDSSAPVSVGGSTEADSIASIVTASGWDIEAGPFIVLPTVDGGMTSGSFLRPEATELTVGDTIGVGRTVADGRIELFSRGGRVGEARVKVENAPRVDPGCTAWPVARLGAASGGSASGGAAEAPATGAGITNWTAAFAAGRVKAIPLDSIEGMATRDSARLAADLTRLASALPDDTSATFRGLPFVVLRAYRARGIDSAFVVATLARRVNQEDSPKEERLVLVVDVASKDSKAWKVAWHERAAGREEELVVAEPLMAYFTTGTRDVHLLFGRDDGIALGAAVLVRTAGGWRVQWESAVAGCD